jgi:hypothetical protein
LLVFCLILFKIVPSIAWGAQGHRLIVETALSMLSPQARQKVLFALGKYSPDRAAVWMDSVRSKDVPEYRYMKNWHFVNMESGQTYAQVASKNDVVYNLQRVIGAMKDTHAYEADSLKQNLRILFHLMGDITQPLHVGYRHDLGGNSDKVVTPVYNDDKNNLHHVWDDIIIQKGKINLQTCIAYYHKMPPDSINAVKKGDTKVWLKQSRSYLSAVYACHPNVHKTTKLSLAYLDSNVPTVQQQLVYASIRLSAVLENAFGNKSSRK